jgi:isopenicillin N synthase-like dioxygenase
MLAAVSAVAELAAEGFGLPRAAFTDLMAFGPHLLAPTGADLEKHGQLGKVIAGFHSDLNFLTIHGKSRYPGLFVWLRDGTRIPVRIPDGCLILQAGKQMEWLTGGHVRAGMHEVVVTDATMPAIAAARSAGRPLWRVSSTVFGHIASDQVLTPLGAFATAAAQAIYPTITAGDFVQKELESIRLKA